MSKIYYATKKTIKEFATGSNILIFVTVLAVIIANTEALKDYYVGLWEIPVSLQIGDFNLFSHNGHPMSLMEFINDALMAIFFFTIGLEIKREVLVGELSSIKQALLPIIGACGGMIVPVLIFHALASPEYANGSAIPMATDIAFSLGILALFGKRVPLSLKIFLTTLAVADDLGGILVIALFYSSHIDYMLLIYSLGFLALLLLGARFQIQSKVYYILIGCVVWYLFLNSGVHATIAGVIVAFCIPAKPVSAPGKYIKTIRESIALFPAKDDSSMNEKTILSNDQLNWLKKIESASDKVISPLQELEDSLHPIVTYFIIPLFAFANAGVDLSGMEISSVYSGVSLAVICGLVLGKLIGIFTFSGIAVKLKFAPMPRKCNYKMLAAVSIVGGIGFTVSLFIATLSYGTNGEILNQAKLGIIVGSVIAAILGVIALNATLPKNKQVECDK